MKNDELLKNAVSAGGDTGPKNYEAYRDAVWEEAEEEEMEEDEMEYAEECAMLDVLERIGDCGDDTLQEECGISDRDRYEDTLDRLEEKDAVYFDRDPDDGHRIIRYVPSLI